MGGCHARQTVTQKRTNTATLPHRHPQTCRHTTTAIPTSSWDRGRLRLSHPRGSPCDRRLPKPVDRTAEASGGKKGGLQRSTTLAGSHREYQALMKPADCRRFPHYQPAQSMKSRQLICHRRNLLPMIVPASRVLLRRLPRTRIQCHLLTECPASLAAILRIFASRDHSSQSVSSDVPSRMMFQRENHHGYPPDSGNPVVCCQQGRLQVRVRSPWPLFTLCHVGEVML